MKNLLAGIGGAIAGAVLVMNMPEPAGEYVLIAELRGEEYVIDHALTREDCVYARLERASKWGTDVHWSCAPSPRS